MKNKIKEFYNDHKGVINCIGIRVVAPLVALGLIGTYAVIKTVNELDENDFERD